MEAPVRYLQELELYESAELSLVIPSAPLGAEQWEQLTISKRDSGNRLAEKEGKNERSEKERELKSEPEEVSQSLPEVLLTSGEERERLTRSVVMQGELLRFFLVLKPSKAFVDLYCGINAKRDIVEFARESSLLQRLHFEFHMAIGKDEKKNGSRNSLGSESSVFTEEERSQLRHTPQLQFKKALALSAMKSELDCERLNAREVEERDRALKSSERTSFLVLPSGELVYPLEAPIVGHMDARMGEIVPFRVVLTAMNFPQHTGLGDALEHLLDPGRLQQSSVTRTVEEKLTVVQPLKMSSRQVLFENRVYLNVCVRNVSNVAVNLEAAKVHQIDSLLTSASEGGRELELGKIDVAEHFAVSLDASPLPVRLLSGDQCMFVICLDSLYESKRGEALEALQFRASSSDLRVHSNLLLTWTAEYVSGAVMSRYPITWPYKQLEDLLITMSVDGCSPPNQVFHVSVTVSNLSRRKRKLLMKINSPEAHADAHEGKSPLICLEQSVQLGRLAAGTSISCRLPFTALEEGIFEIQDVLLYDVDTEDTFHMKEACAVYVTESSPIPASS